MSNGYTNESLEAILESLEYDETDEAARRRSPNRPAAPRTPSYGAPVREQPVTQRQLKETSDKLDARITSEINKVDVRIIAAETKIERQTAALKKESEERKKETARLASPAQLSTLLPLLTTPKFRQIDTPVDALQHGDKVLIDTGDSLSLLLPLLLMGGLGSGAGLGSGSGGGDSGAMGGLDPLLLVLLLSRRS